MSIMSGAHNVLMPAVVDGLKEKGAQDIVVFGGGIIPDDDMESLKQKGIQGLFTPGTSTETIISWVRENVKPR
jgi:methylmalonyl-CoA mutase C-terminal domain/subunit